MAWADPEPAGDSRTPDVAACKAQKLGQQIQCPSCESVSVVDSNTNESQEILASIEDWFTQGFSNDQILDLVAQTYGEDLVLSEPLSGQPAAGEADSTDIEAVLAQEAMKGLAEPPAGPELSGQAALDRANQVGDKLRCPQCQGLSVADSKADAAEAMFARVLELVEQGYTEDQIVDYFVSRFGQDILLEPKVEGMNLLIWVGPLVLIVAGGVLLALKSRRRPVPYEPSNERPSTAGMANENPDDDEGLERLDRRKRSQMDQEDAYIQSIRTHVSDSNDNPLTDASAHSDEPETDEADSAPKERYMKTVLAWVSAGSEAR